MSNQGGRLMFLIRLMFSDSQAKTSWRNFLPTKFYADFFSSDKV